MIGLARLIDKVTYRGIKVDFYDFELLIKEEYGDLDKVPDDSEAYHVLNAWRGGEETPKQKQCKVLRNELNKTYDPDPYAIVYLCEIDSERFFKALDNHGLTTPMVAEIIGVHKSNLDRSRHKKINSTVAKKMQALMPELKDDFILGKKLSKKQPSFGVKVGVFEAIPKDDRRKIFKSYSVWREKRRKQKLSTIELKKVHELYGWKAEDIVKEDK